jgi:hypothetical protein
VEDGRAEYGDRRDGQAEIAKMLDVDGAGFFAVAGARLRPYVERLLPAEDSVRNVFEVENGNALACELIETFIAGFGRREQHGAAEPRRGITECGTYGRE